MKWRDIDNKYVARLEELKRKNAYELLEVSETATLDEIKKSYRKKIGLYHPDRTDSFMREYSQEVVKLLNNAMQEIEQRLYSKALKDK